MNSSDALACVRLRGFGDVKMYDRVASNVSPSYLSTKRHCFTLLPTGMFHVRDVSGPSPRMACKRMRVWMREGCE